MPSSQLITKAWSFIANELMLCHRQGDIYNAVKGNSPLTSLSSGLIWKEFLKADVGWERYAWVECGVHLYWNIYMVEEHSNVF